MISACHLYQLIKMLKLISHWPDMNISAMMANKWKNVITGVLLHISPMHQYQVRQRQERQFL